MSALHSCNSQQIAALILLYAAREEAGAQTRDVWRSALGIGAMRDACRLTKMDLESLVQQGLVQHTFKATRAGRHEPHAPASARFLLSDSGAEFVLRARKTRDELTAAPLVPSWDSRARSFDFGPYVVKAFQVLAQAQEVVLDAFEAQAWGATIANPLQRVDFEDPRDSLHGTIKRLNHNQLASLLRFHGDGTGDGVRWGLSPLGDRVTAFCTGRKK